MKKLIFVAVAILLALGIFKGGQYYILRQAQSKVLPLSMVTDNFTKQGLSVTQQQNSAEEQQFVDNFKAELGSAQSKAGIDPNNNKELAVNSQTVIVNGIAVKLQAFYSSEFAQKAYAKNVATQTKRQEDAQNRNYPYNRTDYFVNGPFLMSINYYKAELVGGKLSPTPKALTLDEAEVGKITQAFKSLAIK